MISFSGAVSVPECFTRLYILFKAEYTAFLFCIMCVIVIAQATLSADFASACGMHVVTAAAQGYCSEPRCLSQVYPLVLPPPRTVMKYVCRCRT